MTLPLKADWHTTDWYGAADQNAAAAAVNALGAGTLRIPKNPWVSADATLALSTVYNVYVHTGTVAVWTLPPIAGSIHSPLQLINRGSGVVSVQASGGDEIYAQSPAASIPLAPGTALEVINDGTYWLATRPQGGGVPQFDNATVSPWQTTIASGAAMTLTHLVGGGAQNYGVVMVYSSNYPDPTQITAAVSLGGVTLNPLGLSAPGSLTYNGWIWVFGAPDIPVGSQTASARLTWPGQTFSGRIACYTVSGAAAVGCFAPFNNMESAPYQSETIIRGHLPRTSPNPGRVLVGASQANGATPIWLGPSQRVYATQLNDLDVWGGDLGVSGPEPANPILAFSGGAPWQMVALDLLGAAPVGPYLTGMGYNPNHGPGLTGQGGTGQANTLLHHARAGDRALAAIGYVPSGGSSVTGVTYAGAAMTLVGSVPANNNIARGEILLYEKAGVAAGPAIIALTQSGAGDSYCMQSLSYAQLASIGVPGTAYGNSASPLHGPIDCAAGQVVLHLFDSYGYPPTETDDATPLWQGGGYGNYAALSIRQSIATKTFTAATGSSTPWAAMSVVLS